MLWIHFLPECKTPVSSGLQTATTRVKQFGEPGDRFSAFGKMFELVEVSYMRLDDAAKTYFKEEGLVSYEGFKDRWLSIPSNFRWKPNLKVCVHKFREVV